MKAEERGGPDVAASAGVTDAVRDSLDSAALSSPKPIDGAGDQSVSDPSKTQDPQQSQQRPGPPGPRRRPSNQPQGPQHSTPMKKAPGGTANGTSRGERKPKKKNNKNPRGAKSHNQSPGLQENGESDSSSSSSKEKEKRPRRQQGERGEDGPAAETGRGSASPDASAISPEESVDGHTRATRHSISEDSVEEGPSPISPEPGSEHQPPARLQDMDIAAKEAHHTEEEHETMQSDDAAEHQQRLQNAGSPSSAPATTRDQEATAGDELQVESDEEQDEPVWHEGQKSTIRVVVRVRPLDKQERTHKEEGAVYVLDDEQTVGVKSEVTETATPYTFHQAQGSACNQDKFFRNCGVRSLLKAAMDGFSCTAFAYGQTGSGKTHTLTGPDYTEDTTGVIQRSIRYLWQQIRRRKDVKYKFRASYLEIYNEQVFDLMNLPRGPLAVRWSADAGFHVDNLFKITCEDEESMMAVLEEGLRNRRIASHEMNERSSRGHTILTLEVDSMVEDTEAGADSMAPTDASAVPYIVRRHGRMSFVDLAGSERVSRTKSEGTTLAESHNINKSLLTLGNCISALADPRKRNKRYIPYRDSYLTMLLKDSLGGTGLTLMIACVSPAKSSLQETKNTLRYASRAKRIQNKPIVHMDPVQKMIQALKREVRLLRAECTYLRDQADQTGGAPGTTLPTNYDALKVPGIDAGQEGHGMANMARELTQAKVYLQQLMRENEDLRADNAQLLVSKQNLEQQHEALESDHESLSRQMRQFRVNGDRARAGLPAKTFKTAGYAASFISRSTNGSTQSGRTYTSSTTHSSRAPSHVASYAPHPPAQRLSANSSSLSVSSVFDSARGGAGARRLPASSSPDPSHRKHGRDPLPDGGGGVASQTSRSYPSSGRSTWGRRGKGTRRSKGGKQSGKRASSLSQRQMARYGDPEPLPQSGCASTRSAMGHAPELRTGRQASTSSPSMAARQLREKEASELDDIDAQIAAMQEELGNRPLH